MLNETPTRKPKSGRVVSYDPQRDPWRRYLAQGLTPVRAANYLKAADAGDLAALVELSEELEERDAHLRSVAATRREALTLLDWRIASSAEIEGNRSDEARAEKVAQFCREALAKIPAFDEALEHLASAIGPNLAVCELVWSKGGDLEDVVPIPANRLTADYQQSQVVRITTAEEPAKGIPAEPGKFVVHVPEARGGFPTRGALIRPALMLHLVKHLSLKDWAIFCEVFGMPVRVAKYRPGASEDEKTEALNMLRLIASDSVGVFSESMMLELVETPNRGVAPYESIVNWAERAMSKLYLGQTLTTDTTGGTGTYAAASVHEGVRQDLLAGDVKREARTIRRYVLGPMVRWRFGAGVTVPYFTRVLDEPVDRLKEAQVIEAASQRIGLRIKEAEVYKRLGFTPPESDEPVIERIATPGGGLPFGALAASDNATPDASEPYDLSGYPPPPARPAQSTLTAHQQRRARLFNQQAPQKAERLAAKHVQRIAGQYRDKVLAPMVARIEGLPEGDDGDDGDQANRKKLQTMLQALDASVLEEMDTDSLAESMADAGVQAELIGWVRGRAQVEESER